MATPKQIEYANKLGIENPEQYETKALSALIDAKLGKTPKTAQKASQSGSNGFTAQSTVILNRTDKPHSFEFGKAGARHKIYYNSIQELEAHMEALKAAGLMSDPVVEGNLVETVRPEDYQG